MTFQTWLLFCITETVLCFIPGPAVLFVLSTALRRGFRSGSVAAAGILAGNTFYFALSATGIAALIVASQAVFGALKWAGAAYLVWLGLRMLLARTAEHAAVRKHVDGTADRLFGRAFIVQAANPKALVFFIALLPQFINPAAAVSWQILILGISSVVIESLVLSLYAALAARARTLTGARFSSSLERIGGACLIGAGARLAWYRIG
ncbi:MAG TPA: LysE family translocator [Steroidobacteraceae bacterium]|jgi:homoserine/homoserine lactone efflux protein